MSKNVIFLQIQLQLYGLDLLFKVVDSVDELLLARHVFGHFRADVMHEFPHFFYLIDRNLERLVERIQ